MRIALVTNASPTSGVGKPARVLAETLRRDPTLTVNEYVIDATTSTIRKNGRVLRQLHGLPPLKPVRWFFLGRLLKCDDTDIVHLTNQTLSFLAPSLRVPTVLTVWDLIELDDPQERGGSLVARFLYRGIPAAHAITTPSRATANAIQRRYGISPERLSIIPPAAALDFRYQPDIWATPGGHAFVRSTGLTLEGPRMLYVGSEHRRKNLPRLLEAVAEVRKRLPDVEFVKIGPPGVASGRREFLTKMSELGLGGAVRLVEHAGNTELLYWYHASRVLAFPTLLEGFGIPPLEAMACGTPVVTSNRSSLPEVVGDAALTVDPEDVQALADVLYRVLVNELLRTELRKKGLYRAHTFSRDRMAAAMLEVYRRAVRAPR